ncbi:LPS assembly protein LptD [Catenovulum sp. SM1970]|uniref:LPS-assembly protein LptD n=1 Tax=Marinifaba aquimaris TaxID=2741323 RepID=UPI00157388F3|nr:LPS assembly protein LptD [Marinifaba aquimaris]NTS77446.1 LPS assembly protein LptD [Marinifaba aquimaris]
MSSKTTIATSAAIISLSSLIPAYAQEYNFKQCFPALAELSEAETQEAKTFTQAPDFSGQNITIDADSVRMSDGNEAIFEGNVEIFSDNSSIVADKAIVSKDKKQLQAQGRIVFNHPNVVVEGQDFSVDVQHSALSISDTEYRLAGYRGHGEAEKIAIAPGEHSAILLDATFTTCPEDEPDWVLRSSEITLSVDGEWGEAWHNRFDVMDVPVIYLPYISFPLTDKRKTGFLMPKLDSSKSKGLDISTPYYINLAENYDATLTPRYMSERGTMMGGEVRYMSEQGLTKFYGEYLNDDKDSPIEEDRHAVKLTYQGGVWGDWKANVDLNQVSDDAYLNDFGFRGFNSVDTHIESLISFYQHHKEWFVEVNFRDFQSFGETSQPYRVLPEIVAEYTPDLGYENFKLTVPMEAAYFENEEQVKPEAIRLHTEPTLTWQWTQPAWEVSAETSLLASAYRQDGIESAVDGSTAVTSDNETITRAIPRVRLNSRMILERPMNWFGKAMTQTLEPRAQYLWVPYEDQSDIGLYDTSLLQDDFYGLFRKSPFSGIDRIVEADQVTLGVTSRLINDKNQEKLQFSIGQIFYLDNTKLDFLDEELELARGESALALDFNFDIRDTWFFHHGLQYDTDLGVTRKSYTKLDYKLDETHVVQVSHRFARDVSGNTISMAGVAGRWEIDENWQMFGSTYHDFENSRELESRIGFIYQSCCWSVQLAYESHIVTDLVSDTNPNEVSNETDNGIMLRFSFGRIGQSGNRHNVLEEGIFGHRRPYFINQ